MQAITPSLQNPRNNRRNAPPADQAALTRLHQATQFPQKNPFAHHHEHVHLSRPKSLRIFRLPVTALLPNRPSWARLLWPALHDSKRRQDPQGPLPSFATAKLTPVHQYGSSSPFSRIE